MTPYKLPLTIVGIAVLVAVGTLVFLSREQPDGAATQPQSAQTMPAPAVAPIEHPVPAPPILIDDAPLPSLTNSDAAFLEHVGEIFNLKQYGEQLILESMITRFVVIVDNLDRRNLPLGHMLTQPPKGKFMVTKAGEDKLFIDERNFQRYDPFVTMLEAMEVKAFVALYTKYYPLFQQAYEEIGYPNKYFNDRFVKIIEHLGATPKLANGPIALVQPVVIYQFADPKLEKLSSGQKVMIRMGGNNAARVKLKLIELRNALTHFTSH